jgi:hypothetical protein
LLANIYFIKIEYFILLLNKDDVLGSKKMFHLHSLHKKNVLILKNKKNILDLEKQYSRFKRKNYRFK